MKKLIFRLLLAGMIIAGTCSLVYAWGVWGHQHINRAAVFALPDSLRIFFFNHIDFITEEAAIPDIRKYTIGDKAEPDRHYIDLEAYGDHPFEVLPDTWAAAVAKYGEDTLHRYGILPWWIQQMTQKLTDAFRLKRADQILFIASDLGHYIGDAAMPLHTSLNHDGQLTGQRGIHAFFESQLPELFGDKYDFHIAPARYIPDLTAEIWQILRESHTLVDSVLEIEKKLHTSLPEDKIYNTDSSGNIIKNTYGQPVHTYAYARAYHDALHGIVERQIRYAAQELASFWYTAWVNAGKPDLVVLDPGELTRYNKKALEKQYRLWEKGHLWGLRSMHEF